ncbi:MULTISPECIES: class I SAM-dependent methyltransferase [unclassified Nonomuraea]|uniref:class I SAM-dependent methyltransferase n=1 Tax=unclassified Nonomuraea TaxID=2593643 RepID=UPI0033D3F909
MSDAPVHPHGPPEDLYGTTPPWDVGRPQPAFAALAEAGEFRGRVLDVGCGTGELALLCAGMGLDVTGVDLAPKGLQAAAEKARERGLAVRWLRHDVLRLGELGETFDTVLDSLIFHIFGDADRATYVESLRAALRPGGRYFMLCFSERQPGAGEYGPRRVTREEIAAAFSDGWKIDSIDAATIDSNLGPEGLAAWLVALIRI